MCFPRQTIRHCLGARYLLWLQLALSQSPDDTTTKKKWYIPVTELQMLLLEDIQYDLSVRAKSPAVPEQSFH